MKRSKGAHVTENIVYVLHKVWTLHLPEDEFFVVSRPQISPIHITERSLGRYEVTLGSRVASRLEVMMPRLIPILYDEMFLAVIKNHRAQIWRSETVDLNTNHPRYSIFFAVQVCRTCNIVDSNLTIISNDRAFFAVARVKGRTVAE
jgi:hypothetical protein